MAEKMIQAEFISKARAIHGNRYDYSDSMCNGAQTVVVIICREHGKFKQRASYHLSGSGCHDCAQKSRMDSNPLHRPKTYKGVSYKSIASMYRAISPDVGYSYFRQLLKTGLSIEEALSRGNEIDHDTGLVYKITNHVNGKIYVGSTKQCVETRFREHVNRSQRGIGSRTDGLMAAIRNHGESSFSIEIIEDEVLGKNLSDREQYHIDQLNSNVPIGYNVETKAKRTVGAIKPVTINGVTYRSFRHAAKALSTEDTFKVVLKSLYNGTYDCAPKSNLDLEMVEEMRELYRKGGVTQKQLGKKYGICQQSVGEIVRNRAWVKNANS